jgi:hypothetical protein
MLDQILYCIPTPLGAALRGEREVKECDEGIRVLGVRPSDVIPALLPTGKYTVLRFSKDDMPDFDGTGSVRNVCGYVAGYSTLSNHPAWRRRRSTLGTFNEAYTLRGGNCIFLRGKVIFKGGTNRDGVHSTMRRLIASPADIVLKAYLVVATTHLHRNLYVQTHCLMEKLIAAQPGCRVMNRHEELSNAIIFYINDFAAFNMPSDRAPDRATVSVSRRGVVNARYTWHDGVEWVDNASWVSLTESVRAFLLRMC